MGAAVYAIIVPEADAQMYLSGNLYYTSNCELMTLVGGKTYRPDEWEAYLSEYDENGAKYVEKVSFEYEAEEWFCESNCGKFGVKIFTDIV